MNKFSVIFQNFETVLHWFAKRGVALSFGLSLIAAGALFYFVGYPFLITPAALANDTLRAENKTISDEVERGLAIEASEKQFNAEFERVVVKFKEQEPRLPRATEVANALADIQASATKFGVVIRGLSAAREPVQMPDGKLFKRDMPVTVVGPLKNVILFLYDLANKERIFVIEDFSMVSFKDTVSTQFSLSIYHSLPKESLPALPPALQHLLKSNEKIINAAEVTVPALNSNAGRNLARPASSQPSASGN